jgi:hypothetical protein
MSKVRQYVTTGASLYDTDDRGYRVYLEPRMVPDPVPPDFTDTWDLKSSIEYDGNVLWFWQRDVESS